MLWKYLVEVELLSPGLSILLDMDFVAGFESVDCLIGKLDTGSKSIRSFGSRMSQFTNVKPLIKVYSCLMVPPSDLACSLALRLYVSWSTINPYRYIAPTYQSRPLRLPPSVLPVAGHHYNLRSLRRQCTHIKHGRHSSNLRT